MREIKAKYKIVFYFMVMIIAVVGLRVAFGFFYRAAYPVRYSGQVMEQSGKNNLPPSLVYAVIRTESGFNPDAKSHVDAIGLMQITEDTFEWARYRENEPRQDFDTLYDGATNIRYGTAILRLLLEEFGTVENALLAYHAGWGNVKKWLANPALSPDGVHITHIPFGVTAYYVDRVFDTQKIYQRLYGLE